MHDEALVCVCVRFVLIPSSSSSKFHLSEKAPHSALRWCPLKWWERERLLLLLLLKKWARFCVNSLGLRPPPISLSSLSLSHS